MAEAVLTLRELNRATLARQLLLDRVRQPALNVVAQVAGLQAQVVSPPYIGLWTRLPDFRRDDLNSLLMQRKIVRATFMRSTLHLVTAEDYKQMWPTLQPALARALNAFFGQQAKVLDIARLIEVARPFIAAAPRTFAEVRALLTRLEPDKSPEALAYVVRTHLPLVQVPLGSGWGYSSNPAYTLAEDWFNQPLATASNLAYLVQHYLTAFGPATVRDIQAWSGLIGLKEAVNALKPGLSLFRDERGNELLDWPGLVRPAADTPALPRFLPEYDNLILSHADRTRIVPDKYRPLIFLSAGRVRATFLVDGFVAGVWKIEREGTIARLLIEPFEPLSDNVADELLAEGERLLGFIQGAEAKNSPTSFEVRLAEARS